MEDIDTEYRPLIKDKKEKLYELYQERYLLYKKYCNYEIMNNGSLQGVVEKIMKKLKVHSKTCIKQRGPHG